MQNLQGHSLSSLIPRPGEEGPSQVAQPQAGQKCWSWGQNVLHLLPFSCPCQAGALDQLHPTCGREEDGWHLTGLFKSGEDFRGVTLRHALSCAPEGARNNNVWKRVREEETHKPLLSLCSFIHLFANYLLSVCTMLQTLKQMPSLPSRSLQFFGRQVSQGFSSISIYIRLTQGVFPG